MRRILPLMLVCACLGMLTACGFRPLYAPAQDVSGRNLLDQVWIETIQGANGVILRNYLLDGFYREGYPDAPRYVLNIGLREFGRDVDVQKDDTTTRAQSVQLADYTLRDRVTNTVIDQGQFRSVSGYNILLSQYTTLVTQNDARDRALKEMADKIQTRIALVLSEPELQAAPPPALVTAP